LDADFADFTASGGYAKARSALQSVILAKAGIHKTIRVIREIRV